MLGRHQADVWQIAIALGIIHAVADDEEVRNREANIIGFNLLQAARRLVEQGSNAQALGFLLQKEFAQIAQGQTGVENVFNDQNILALNRVPDP